MFEEFEAYCVFYFYLLWWAALEAISLTEEEPTASKHWFIFGVLRLFAFAAAFIISRYFRSLVSLLVDLIDLIFNGDWLGLIENVFILLEWVPPATVPGTYPDDDEPDTHSDEPNIYQDDDEPDTDLYFDAQPSLVTEQHEQEQSSTASIQDIPDKATSTIQVAFPLLIPYKRHIMAPPPYLFGNRVQRPGAWRQRKVRKSKEEAPAKETPPNIILTQSGDEPQERESESKCEELTDIILENSPWSEPESPVCELPAQEVLPEAMLPHPIDEPQENENESRSEKLTDIILEDSPLLEPERLLSELPAQDVLPEPMLHSTFIKTPPRIKKKSVRWVDEMLTPKSSREPVLDSVVLELPTIEPPPAEPSSLEPMEGIIKPTAEPLFEPMESISSPPLEPVLEPMDDIMEEPTPEPVVSHKSVFSSVLEDLSTPQMNFKPFKSSTSSSRRQEWCRAQFASQDTDMEDINTRTLPTTTYGPSISATLPRQEFPQVAPTSREVDMEDSENLEDSSNRASPKFFRIPGFSFTSTLSPFPSYYPPAPQRTVEEDMAPEVTKELPFTAPRTTSKVENMQEFVSVSSIPPSRNATTQQESIMNNRTTATNTPTAFSFPFAAAAKIRPVPPQSSPFLPVTPNIQQKAATKSNTSGLGAGSLCFVKSTTRKPVQKPSPSSAPPPLQRIPESSSTKKRGVDENEVEEARKRQRPQEDVVAKLLVNSALLQPSLAPEMPGQQLGRNSNGTEEEEDVVGLLVNSAVRETPAQQLGKRTNHIEEETEAATECKRARKEEIGTPSSHGADSGNTEAAILPEDPTTKEPLNPHFLEAYGLPVNAEQDELMRFVSKLFRELKPLLRTRDETRQQMENVMRKMEKRRVKQEFDTRRVKGPPTPGYAPYIWQHTGPPFDLWEADSMRTSSRLCFKWEHLCKVAAAKEQEYVVVRQRMVDSMQKAGNLKPQN